MGCFVVMAPRHIIGYYTKDNHNYQQTLQSKLLGTVKSNYKVIPSKKEGQQTSNFLNMVSCKHTFAALQQQP